MKILGIETATALCAAAIVADGNVLSEHNADSPQIHSEKLLSIIKDCFQSAKCELSLLDGIAVSIGPGSFTGLRIGLSVAKGLSYTSGKPLAAIPTLKGLAKRALSLKYEERVDFILPLLDARRDEVYMALYCRDGNLLREIIPSSTLSVEQVYNSLPDKKKILILGDGAEKFQQYSKITDNYDFSSYIISLKDVNRCSAAAIAFLGEEMIATRGGEDINSLEPLYVKDFYTLAKTQHQKETI
jgi:tRNA threonylcarbamoyladenosine biosynthesis protein TsaB